MSYNDHREEIARLEHARDFHLNEAVLETNSATPQFEASHAHSNLAIAYQMQITQKETQWDRMTREA